MIAVIGLGVQFEGKVKKGFYRLERVKKAFLGFKLDY
jgi:hypothetical protein